MSALTGFTDSYCDELERKLDSAISSLYSARSAMRDPLNQVQGKLNDYLGTPVSDINIINNGLNQIGGAADSSVPAIPDTSDIQELMDKCLDLKLNFELNTPEGIVGDFFRQIGDALADALGAVFDLIGDVIEFVIGKLFQLIDTILSQFDLSGLLGLLDGFLDCIDVMCGRDVSGKIDTVNYLLDDMNVGDDGKLDRGKLFSTAGLDTSRIDALTTVDDGIISATTDAATKAVTSGVNLKSSVKSIKKQAVTAVADKIDIPFA